MVLVSVFHGQRRRVGLAKAFLFNCCGYCRRKTRHPGAEAGESYDPYDFSDTEGEMPQGKSVSPTDKAGVPLTPDSSELLHVLVASHWALFGALCPRSLSREP